MTRRVMQGYDGPWGRGVRFRSDQHESSCVVIPRSVWEITGGFDERFVGWGQEDVAFIQAARLLVGPIERVDGFVWHLWHPKSDDRRHQGSAHYQQNQALGQRYRDAVTAEDVLALIAERGVDLSQRAERFDRIYTFNEWRGKGGTRAGPGSSMEATAALQEALPGMLADLGCTSVLDAGCSDALWMPDLPGYVGVDIVPRAIDVARKRHPGRRFEVADICTDPLPACDAVICRDALQHLSLADGLAALQNFRRSGAKYLLANTHRGGANQDIVTGEWYEIDLEAGPWWLGAPIQELPDGIWAGKQNRYPTKHFCVWEL